MEEARGVVEEGKELLRKLSLSNQSYLMALVRVAAVAENSVRGMEREGEALSADAGSML